jgi:hypothetical protein
VNPAMSPIQGISLERYAELCAEVAGHENDPEAQARIVQAQGVARSDWDAAVRGWTDRMRDVSLMGQVAQAFQPLYQAALARKRGTVDVSFEDFVALSAAAKAWGLDRMLATYGLDSAAWTQIAGAWTGQRIPQNPHTYGGYGLMVEQEAARLAAGGQHRAVNIMRTAGGGAAAGPAAPASTFGSSPQGIENQMARNMAQQNVAAHMAAAQAQAAAAYDQASKNVGFFGRIWLKLFGYGSIANGIGPGMQVFVQLDDGQRLPCTVGQVGGGQVSVVLHDGRQMWVKASALSKTP